VCVCVCVTWLIHMCDVTHSYVWHDSFMCVPWFIHICVTWLIHMCDVTHLHVWRDSFINETWPIHMCDMTHWYVRHDSLICVTWLIHMCAQKPKKKSNTKWFLMRISQMISHEKSSNKNRSKKIKFHTKFDFFLSKFEKIKMWRALTNGLWLILICRWVMYTWMCHVTCGFVTSRMN